MVAEYKFESFGGIIYPITEPPKYSHFRRRSYIHDQECNLYYLQSRYYDPKVGRFLNADAFASTGQGILGHNMFAYCLNNPVNHSDKSGRTAEDWAGWIGEQLGELIYEWITKDDHPSHQTRELENQIRQKQNSSFGNGLKTCWNAYVHSIELEVQSQYRHDMAVKGFVEERFSTPEKATNSLAAIAFTLEGVSLLTKACPPASAALTVVAWAVGGIAIAISIYAEE